MEGTLLRVFAVAGTYTTTEFQPALTYTVPDGWNNRNDHPRVFSMGTEGELNGDIPVFKNFVAALSGPDHDWPPEPDESVGGSVEDLVQWLTEHPELAVTEPEAVTVGGLAGFQVDIGFAETATSTTAWCDTDLCMHLFADPVDEGGYNLYGSGDVFRAYLLTTGDGDTLLVFIDEWPENTTEALHDFLEIAQPIIDSFEFGE